MKRILFVFFKPWSDTSVGNRWPSHYLVVDGGELWWIVVDGGELSYSCAFKNLYQKLRKFEMLRLKNIFNVSDSFKHSKNTSFDSFRVHQFVVNQCYRRYYSKSQKFIIFETQLMQHLSIPVRGVAPRSLNHFKPQVLTNLQQNLCCIVYLCNGKTPISGFFRR